jgi:photosystem II stability/assembly factor-like uncharacterized protein
MPTRTPIRARIRRTIGACALACVAASIGLASQPDGAASATASVVVSMTVPSASFVDASGCATNTAATNFGVVLPGSSTTTSADCTVLFGSSNDVASLHLTQTDRLGGAMNSREVTQAGSYSSPNGDLRDVDTGSALVGWAAGKSGLAATVDGGASWTYPAAGVTNNSNGVTAWSTTNAILVGGGGLIRRTTNGTTWNTMTSGTVENLNDVADAGAAAIWAVGDTGTILHSVDGGATWSSQASGTAVNLTNVSVVSASVAWAAGAGGLVLRTIDGGTTWTVAQAWTSGGCVYATGIVATSSVDAYLTMSDGCNAGSHRVTSNGGTSWTSYADASADVLADVASIGGGVMVGPAGYGVRRSTDSGVTYGATGNSTSIVSLNAVAAFDASTVVAVGALGTVVRSTDGGLTWADANSGADRAFSDLEVTVPGSTWWAVGEQGRIVRTTNSGTAWSVVASGTTADLYGVSTSGSAVLAVGRGGVIRRSTDQGATWAGVASPTGVDLLAVDGDSSGRAWAVGSGGVVIRSSDAGATWTSTTLGAGTWRDVATSGAGEVWVAGDAGAMRRSVDGGLTWATITVTGNPSMTSIAAPEPGVLWTVGGGVRRTIDGGTTWSVNSDYGAVNGGGTIASINSGMAVLGWSIGSLWTSGDANATWPQASGCGCGDWRDADIAEGGAIVVVGRGGNITKATPVAAIPDYAPGGGAGWPDPGGLFGACLRAATNGTTLAGDTWAAATSGCSTSGSEPWHAISTTDDAASRVARATGTNAARVDLRFGMKVADAQKPGTYLAPISFDVIAPAV